MIYEPELSQLIDKYNECRKALARERESRWCQQSEIVRQEGKMASIEDRFQKAGMDIDTYL